MVKKTAKVIANTIIYVAIFGLIGGIIDFIFDVIGESGVVLYVLWAVMGILCGILSYQNGGQILSGEPQGDWSYHKDAARTGLLVVVIELFTLLARVVRALNAIIEACQKR